MCDSSSQGTTTFVVPLGPNPCGEKLSTPISTAVASAVVHVTSTGAVVAAPHLRSPTSNDVTSAAAASVAVDAVSVVSDPPDPPQPATSALAATATSTHPSLTLTSYPLVGPIGQDHDAIATGCPRERGQPCLPRRRRRHAARQ